MGFDFFKTHRGFSLIEVLITVVILMIAGISILSTFTGGVKLFKTDRKKDRALELANVVMGKARSECIQNGFSDKTDLLPSDGKTPNGYRNESYSDYDGDNSHTGDPIYNTEMKLIDYFEEKCDLEEPYDLRISIEKHPPDYETNPALVKIEILIIVDKEDSLASNNEDNDISLKSVAWNEKTGYRQ